ncbi:MULTISPECIES: hypothetical protein [unclassified Bradyrhizobium]|uniref:hypothetical protein n=1 Tax=unclassified Bradyrhizobium TaxID=2631580 RepID=UPI001BA5EFAE|nr:MULTISPECIES: hypothetical protein [unclassified Bradyrhizobium]MBR1204514.1 hypothetical protein [Bradyrhizobium sp. AUGA SZCCT0124]MBR1309600.1 hypothetical protein [Bradyrhizobium sp. AUGA SZCCT0051]MBR1339741.1 hypothetical protein [Bradyrhizobium sp. AUGA SZCCT0105]MBR1354348.1 hypothetical protein [Bradyrhizobium sp. AUGA SZCCT0045]
MAMTALFAWICAAIAAIATLGAAYFFDKSAEEGIAHAEEKAAHANELAGQAHERAAALEKEAANARLETERLKQAVTWRTLPIDVAEKLEAELSKAPGSVNLRYTDGDPEALYLAIQIGNILGKAKWQVAPGAVKPSGMIMFGISIADVPGAKSLRAAFTAANVPYSNDVLQQSGVAFNIATIQGAPVLMIGSKQPPSLK